jgi:hypothetical protein
LSQSSGIRSVSRDRNLHAKGIPELYGSNEVIRYTHRANHIYVLFSSLVNLILGFYLRPVLGWKKKLATVGSVLLLSAPVVLVIAFFVEAPKDTSDRWLTLVGVFMVFLGVLCHLPQIRSA